MAKILGLDLGTNSIGWAVIDENSETPLLKKAVRIFSEGMKIDKGIESSKASERTKYRSARRLRFRRKLRKYETLKVLIENKMCPLKIEELILWRHKKIYPKSELFLNWLKTHEDKNPYFFRNLVSKEKLNLENETERFMLGRAFYHLAQRRGFKSNRLEQEVDGTQEFELFIKEIELAIKESENITELILEFENFFNENEHESKNVKSQINKIKNVVKFWKASQKIYKQLNIDEEKEKISKIINQKENLGDVKGGIKELSVKIKENNCITLGQYFYLQYKDVKKIRSHYTHREEHYEKEFNIICKKQELEKK